MMMVISMDLLLGYIFKTRCILFFNHYCRSTVLGRLITKSGFAETQSPTLTNLWLRSGKISQGCSKFPHSRESSPAGRLQFYQTWGRPFGLASECPSLPQFCEYSTMQVWPAVHHQLKLCHHPLRRLIVSGAWLTCTYHL